MAKSDDVQIALGALSIISEGLSQAHATDVQFRIAELQAKQDDARIASAEAQKHAEILWALNREAKQEYQTSLEKVSSRYKGINAEELTSTGQALVTDLYEGKKFDIDKINQSTQVYDDRRKAADKLYRDLQGQEIQLNKMKTMIDPITGQPFFGLSQYLNPDEFERLKEYAMTADDPKTAEVEGLGWDEKYPGIGTAGIEAAYREEGSDVELRTLEMSAIDKQVARLDVNFKADFTTLKTMFTTDEDTDGQSLSEKSEAYGIPENVFSQMSTLFLVNDPESALKKLYSLPGDQGEQLLKMLRENQFTYNLFNTMEINYDKIFKLKAEAEGLSLTDESAAFKDTIRDYANSSDKTIEDAMYVMKTKFDQGIGYTQADEMMEFIANQYNITIEEAQDIYSGVANLGVTGSNKVEKILASSINPYDGPFALYTSDSISDNVKFPGADSIDVVASYKTDDGETVYIDVNKIYESLDQIKIHGDDFVVPQESIYWQWDDAHEVMTDQINEFGDDPYYQIATDIYDTGNFMYFNDTPSMNHKGIYGVKGWGNTPPGGYETLEDYMLNSDDTVMRDWVLQYSYLKDTDPARYQRELESAFNASHWMGLVEGIHYDHSKIPGWSAANAYGVSYYNKTGESEYWDVYNEEMELQMDALLDANHAIKAGKGSQNIDEQRVGGLLQWYEVKYDAPGYYENAHRIADGKAKAAQIEYMKEIIENSDDNPHKFRALLNSLDIIENANIEHGTDFIPNANQGTNELNVYRGIGRNSVSGFHDPNATLHIQSFEGDEPPFIHGFTK